jgi:hypothetical protein
MPRSAPWKARTVVFRVARTAAFELISPKVLEPCRRQFRISNRVADVSMPEVILNCSRIVAITSELVSRTMPQHVRMKLKGQSSLLTRALHQPIEPMPTPRVQRFPPFQRVARIPRCNRCTRCNGCNTACSIVGAARPGMSAAYAAWSAREIELQALATLAARAQISTPSAAHFLKSHQLLVQKFATDRDRQRSSFETGVRRSAAGP